MGKVCLALLFVAVPIMSGCTDDPTSTDTFTPVERDPEGSGAEPQGPEKSPSPRLVECKVESVVRLRSSAHGPQGLELNTQAAHAKAPGGATTSVQLTAAWAPESALSEQMAIRVAGGEYHSGTAPLTMEFDKPSSSEWQIHVRVDGEPLAVTVETDVTLTLIAVYQEHVDCDDLDLQA